MIDKVTAWFSGRTLRQQLAILVIATALPLLICAGLMAERLVSNERQGLRQNLMVSAKTLASLVDNEIATHAAIASTLAASPNLQHGDLAAFWAEAKQALAFVPGSWLALSVPDGPIVLNTLAPFGTLFPNHAAPAVVRRGFETRQSQLGDLVFGPVARRPTAFVEVPVFRDNAPAYSISVALPPERMLGLITAQFTHGEVVGILDRNLRFIARVPDHAQRLGTLASEGWRGAIAKASEGWVDIATLEGDPSVTAYAPTRDGWTVGVAVLNARINKPIREILLTTALLAAALLLVSASLATVLARHTDRGIALLADAARALRTGNVVVAPPAPFLEAAEIGTTLASVSAELKHRADLLGRHSEELEAEVVSRTSALVAETERRAALEDQLRQSQKMEAVGQLTGGIAHDFNNMLAVVVGALDLLGRRLETTADPQIKRYAAMAADGAGKAALLTQRLLAFSRQQPLRPETIDMNRVVAGMSDLLRRSLGSEVQLETVLGGGLWRVSADPNQIENLILNLAINARDAMPDGGRLTIETQNAHLDERYTAAHAEVAAGQYVLVAVTDTGTGMSPDVVKKAFDPFFTTKDVGKGTGLGLSQVYGFVKQSCGHVKIYSEVGQGTTVKIYLPKLVAVVDDRSMEQAARPRNLSARNGETILVVDDEEAVRSLTVDALSGLGYAVLAADGAASALKALDRRSDISLMFTDVVMPEVNGRKLADEALRRRPALKVLFTTGYTRNAVVHNGVLDAGVELLGKPFTVAELADKVRDVLDGNQSDATT